ncbi:MAG: methylenetetrahydrofolate--tRNA-(uracil(54)-C(5))-methyltransferase (FADH(2)-oxidizing) TrmFO [Magnetococcales bacterium]|nr:methylenetetrahydrofolate--tRNA-(uracil(54)-C(5))-methyltransferase (FADH(2)-oxidizing) TrmFO [Magnetococcales bacterium]
MNAVTVVGAGLAGSEAAWQLAQRGIAVTLVERRPVSSSPAHQSDRCAELVCSNSLRSDDAERSAVGLLHEELRGLGSLIMAAADHHRVPAGSALAVDREAFAAFVTERLEQHPLITLRREELFAPPEEGWVVLATGPLTADTLAAWLETAMGRNRLSFYDAIAPIVTTESIDFSKVWKQSRHDKGEGADYINCPLSPDQYRVFVEELKNAKRAPLREFEKIPFFEGCLPIEIMADRGPQTLRFGPMKPVGLQNPFEDGRRPYAVVQLRQDNHQGSLWNMVGFQTRLLWPEQQRLFRTIPGLEQAEFPRLGSVHRNTFLESPKELDGVLRWRKDPRILFAGQITGVEGYVESTAMGALAGRFLADLYQDRETLPPPATTAVGALLHHITVGSLGPLQPMNCNFGLFTPLPEETPRAQRKTVMVARAREDFSSWLTALNRQ